MSTVFVVGSLNIDQNVRVSSLPRAGETVRGTDATFSPGGKGGNQAVAAARAGAHVKFTGAVGDDPHGRRILDVLSDARIDHTQLRVVGNAPTGTAIIAVDDRGENQIIVSPGANSSLTADDVEAGLGAMQAGDILVLQLEIASVLVRQAAAVARSRGAFVILNAAPAPGRIDGLLDDVDLLVVNEQEIRAVAEILGMPPGNHLELVQSLPPVLGAAIVCTAGAEGSFAVLDGGLVHVPASAAAAVDTTGAGDTFVGYLAASLLATPGDLAGAMRRASSAAALAVTRTGAMESIPWQQELQAAPTSALPTNFVSN
ncbi:ribokinase [Arthrobacter sp. NicSoilB4]|uniref:ribokinase n=1 Tax=Arthrobacter sp. NicSoilB4 TaxID=2830997 RepID=UPI001CC3B759|nr:ribokinase [Arthrobacter sp. NicSoilB4]BCW65286.1 ribokinase [Arthrobacter sp. NicSoilB4]